VTLELALVALLLLAAAPVVAQVPVLAPTAEGCCISVTEYFRMRDSLVVQLTNTRADYQALRDSLNHKAPQFTIAVALGPGVFYSFDEKRLVSGFGVTIGVRLAKIKIF